jgi:hypothetical protein
MLANYLLVCCSFVNLTSPEYSVEPMLGSSSKVVFHVFPCVTGIVTDGQWKLRGCQHAPMLSIVQIGHNTC